MRYIPEVIIVLCSVWTLYRGLGALATVAVVVVLVAAGLAYKHSRK